MRMQRKDAQMNAVLLGMSQKEREAVQALSAQFPQATQFIKEFVAFGGPVTKEGNMQAAMMGTLTTEIGNTITAVKNGQSVPGALGTLENLAASSPQIAAETKVMADMVKLSIAGSTNTVVQMAEKNFNAQFELMNKTQAGVVTNVLQSLTPGLDRFKNAADAASETVTGLNKAFQTGKISISQIAEAVYRSDKGGAALRSVGNTAAAISNVAQRTAAELKMDTSKTQAVGPSVDVTRQGYAPMTQGGIIDGIAGLLPDAMGKALNAAMTGLGELVKQGNTANVAAIDNLTVEVKKLTTSNKRLGDITKENGTH